MNNSNDNLESSAADDKKDIGNITSVGFVAVNEPEPSISTTKEDIAASNVHSYLVIERGEAANHKFFLSAAESLIGRWDADNGIFPDIDLDAFDKEAKVSRRHARIMLTGSGYLLEDLGSTNGSFINRGRRLLPGTPQSLADGDEIIVGKTFMRFYIIKKTAEQ